MKILSFREIEICLWITFILYLSHKIVHSRARTQTQKPWLPLLQSGWYPQYPTLNPPPSQMKSQASITLSTCAFWWSNSLDCSFWPCSLQLHSLHCSYSLCVDISEVLLDSWDLVFHPSRKTSKLIPPPSLLVVTSLVKLQTLHFAKNSASFHFHISYSIFMHTCA